MKAHLEFDLSDLEDMYAYRRCNESLNMYLAFFSLLYDDEKLPMESRQRISEVLEEYGVNINELGE